MPPGKYKALQHQSQVIQTVLSVQGTKKKHRETDRNVCITLASPSQPNLRHKHWLDPVECFARRSGIIGVTRDDIGRGDGSEDRPRQEIRASLNVVAFANDAAESELERSVCLRRSGHKAKLATRTERISACGPLKQVTRAVAIGIGIAPTMQRIIQTEVKDLPGVVNRVSVIRRKVVVVGIEDRKCGGQLHRVSVPNRCDLDIRFILINRVRDRESCLTDTYFGRTVRNPQHGIVRKRAAGNGEQALIIELGKGFDLHALRLRD